MASVEKMLFTFDKDLDECSNFKDIPILVHCILCKESLTIIRFHNLSWQMRRTLPTIEFRRPTTNELHLKFHSYIHE